ncbi:MAG TPA: hypothetical protein VJ831_08410 [Jatrophihabitantaceae bacterium]|nr:hypothetical protein [Jatrophihabitantaceae bacterium]
MTLPPHWTGTQALAKWEKWDPQRELDIDSSEVDPFRSGGNAAAFGVAAAWQRDLAAYTSFLIDWTNRTHGETCPEAPETKSTVTIGGQPGVLLAYNCGILINLAATVHGGVAYFFVFRNEAVDAATDPTDHATFLAILRSVKFPA